MNDTRRAFLARTAALGGCALLGDTRSAQVTNDKLDLLIKGGELIDPARGMRAIADLGVRASQIVAIEPDIAASRAARIIDAKGKLVTPGLIDLHAHVYPYGSAIGVSADEHAMRGAVTTLVSAGDAGANNFAAFRRYAATQSRCRIYAFVHIAMHGLSRYPAPELLDIGHADVDAAARAIAENHDVVLGVKVRQALAVVGKNGLEPLRRAIAAVERAQTRGRVMCDIGAATGQLSTLLDLLRPGDILTHTYSGAGNDMVQDGKLLPAALAAQRRGVIIDVGHGRDSFDYTIAEPAIRQGLVPDVISSDLHTMRGASPDTTFLPQVMSKFLNMGFSLEQVIAMTTTNPARVINRVPKLGTLELGAPADLSILERIDAATQFVDTRGNTRTGTQWIKPVQAIRAGVAFGWP